MEMMERILLMADIAGRTDGAGKTAMMKFMYLLQTLYHVPLDYDFEIYTYGPFCQTVMSDIEYAEFLDILNISQITYSSGVSGYNIQETRFGEAQVAEERESLQPYEAAVEDVLSFFGGKTARDLELYSTIVYVAKETLDSGDAVEKTDICTTVKEIKPHFTMETIRSAFQDLECAQLLQKLNA